MNKEELQINPNITDDNFDYPNVWISDHYHLIYNKKPKRDVLAFNPVLEKARGIVGLNFLSKADEPGLEIVNS